MKHTGFPPLSICLLLVFGFVLFGTASADEKDDVRLGRHDLIDDYESALDHLTREFLFLMEKKKLLVVWCFDQSESMKDDQPELFTSAVHGGHCSGKRCGVSGQVPTARTPPPFPQSRSMKVKETLKDQSRRTSDRCA
jgi:hypothetical protein